MIKYLICGGRMNFLQYARYINSPYIMVRKFATKNRSTKNTGENFNFPRHKDYFTDDYWNQNGSEEEEEEPKMTRTMMQKMEKQLGEGVGKEGEHVMDRLTSDFQEEIGDYFGKYTSDADLMNTTREFTMRTRLFKQFHFTSQFKERYVDRPYGNYEKYKNNYQYVEEEPTPENELDTGYSKAEYKMKNFFKRTKVGNREEELVFEEKKQTIREAYMHQKIKSKDEAQEDMKQFKFGPPKRTHTVEELLDSAAQRIEPPKKLERIMDERSNEEFKDQLGKEMFQNKGSLRELLHEGNRLQSDALFDNEEAKVARPSPECRQKIYTLYLTGWTIEDLSLKFGLLPARIKAIVWCRQHFWEEVYPKVGETGMRLAHEAEYDLAAREPFVDYGGDLSVMGDVEKGIPLYRVRRGPSDRNPPPALRDKLTHFYQGRKAKMVDIVPIKFVGRGNKGYIVKEMIVRRGRAAARVTKAFREVCYFADKYPNMLNRTQRKRAHLGPRLASLGWRDRERYK